MSEYTVNTRAIRDLDRVLHEPEGQYSSLNPAAATGGLQISSQACPDSPCTEVVKQVSGRQCSRNAHAPINQSIQQLITLHLI